MSEYTVSEATWPDQTELIFKLREAVFVFEQGVPPKIEWDGRDHLCQHVIAHNLDDVAIGTGRLLPNGHIGRIAVIATRRGEGIGGALLTKLIELAKIAHKSKVYLNSQIRAREFYKRFGFVGEGKVFMEAGIPHQRMTLVF